MDPMKAIVQEYKKGHDIQHLGGDLFLEVFDRGKTFGRICRWFEADDGTMYRTKNGLTLPVDEMRGLLAFLNAEHIALAFVDTEIQHPWEES